MLPDGLFKSAHTSVCMLGTDPVLPLAIAELLLLGLLGPEPGALLQREETGRETDRARARGIIQQIRYKY